MLPTGRRHWAVALCLCGSGSKYKRCHSTHVEASFRR
ncbi:hypothetical protein EIP98_18020 [Xanthomonas campestris pv. raphani]